MRSLMLSLAILTIVVPVFAQPSASTPVPFVGQQLSDVTAPMLALAMQPKDVDVDINVNKGGGAWWKNPWILGVGALVLVLIVVLASRGGGTTIVERR